MQYIKLLFLTLFMFTGALSQAPAQPLSESNSPNIEKESENYALLIRNFNHLKAAVATIETMTEDNTNAVDNFEVVICGKQLTDINEHKSLVKKAQRKGLTLTACGMTMDNFSMAKEDLPDGVQVEPNGLIRIFELQEQGYKTITL